MSEVSAGVIPDEQDSVPQSGLKSPYSPALNRWLREPLLHFILIGIAVFGVYSYTHRGRGGVESSRQITLTLDELGQMDMLCSARIQWMT